MGGGGRRGFTLSDACGEHTGEMVRMSAEAVNPLPDTGAPAQELNPVMRDGLNESFRQSCHDFRSFLSQLLVTPMATPAGVDGCKFAT